jgi:hypothetical protein
MAAAAQEPCRNTLHSWCEEQLVPFEMRGGLERTALVGMDLLLMCLYLTAYPAASGDEIAIHIINNGGGVYDRPVISRRMAELNLTKKQGSTEAYQAFSVSDSFGPYHHPLAFLDNLGRSSLTPTSVALALKRQTKVLAMHTQLFE